MCWLAWNAGRRDGMLKNFDWIGAMTTMQNRIKSTLTATNDGPTWGSILFRKVNLDMSAVLHSADVEWWQSTADIVSPATLRQPKDYDKLVSAFRMLVDNSTHLFSKTPATAEYADLEMEIK